MFKHTQHFGPVSRSKLDLMGIRFIDAGGDGDGAGGDGDAAAQAAAAAAAANDAAPWTKENFDPERAQRLVENLRGDIAAQKGKTESAIAEAVAQSQKDFAATLAKALGGGEQEETDPVKLAAKVTDLSSQIASRDGDLTTAQAAVKAANLFTSVAVLAPGLGGSARLLLANDTFKTSIASVDPADEAAITAKITAAIQANAALKTTPPSSGGSNHTGGQTQALEAQLAAATKAGDIATSITLKRRIAAAKHS